MYLTRLFCILQYHYSAFMFIYKANDLLLLYISLPAMIPPHAHQILQRSWFFFSSCVSLWEEPRWQVDDQKLFGMRQAKNMKETDLWFLPSLYLAFNFIVKHWICVCGLFCFFKKLFYIANFTRISFFCVGYFVSLTFACLLPETKKRGKETWSFRR